MLVLRDICATQANTGYVVTWLTTQMGPGKGVRGLGWCKGSGWALNWFH